MHDRVDGDGLPVTHETLPAMVGVHRSGVAAISALQEAWFVRCGRGRIKVLNRTGLETVAAGRPIGGAAPASEARRDRAGAPSPVGAVHTVAAPRRLAARSGAETPAAGAEARRSWPPVR